MSAFKTLSANLKILRAKRGWTQQETAEKIGVDYKYYQRVESGRWSGLTLKNLDKFAKGFKLEAADLIRRM